MIVTDQKTVRLQAPSHTFVCLSLSTHADTPQLLLPLITKMNQNKVYYCYKVK